MFDGGAGFQGQRDIVIRSGNRFRDIVGITVLWTLVFGLGFYCGALTWANPVDIKAMVAAEVPGQVRLILLP